GHVTLAFMWAQASRRLRNVSRPYTLRRQAGWGVAGRLRRRGTSHDCFHSPGGCGMAGCRRAHRRYARARPGGRRLSHSAVAALLRKNQTLAAGRWRRATVLLRRVGVLERQARFGPLGE